MVTAGADDQGLAIEANGRVDRYAHGITLMKSIATHHVDLAADNLDEAGLHQPPAANASPHPQ